MKKIGIITINDDNNYGNRLQCYAVQEILKKLNFDVENIYNSGKTRRTLLKKVIKQKLKLLLKKNDAISSNNRYKCFVEFNKYIRFSKYKVIRGKYRKKINEQYDYFIVGSDQVWNPNFDTTTDADFLTFTDDNKKIAYSASFGISELPKEKELYYKEKLTKFKAISVREDAGKSIIEKITDRKDVEVLIDPTMMLKQEDWDRVAKKPKQLKAKKYILNYFLGDLPVEWEEEINRIAKENDCEIINILKKNDPFYITGPSEFIYLEKNAFLVCTDSFHSSVFSILYNTPFIVFDRQGKHSSMNSRLETLLSKFNLQDRKFDGKITNDMLTANYKEKDIVLKNEREKALKFLQECLTDQKEHSNEN